jgi:hypothetical protein
MSYSSHSHVPNLKGISDFPPFPQHTSVIDDVSQLSQAVSSETAASNDEPAAQLMKAHTSSERRPYFRNQVARSQISFGPGVCTFFLSFVRLAYLWLLGYVGYRFLLRFPWALPRACFKVAWWPLLQHYKILGRPACQIHLLRATEDHGGRKRTGSVWKGVLVYFNRARRGDCEWTCRTGRPTR